MERGTASRTVVYGLGAILISGLACMTLIQQRTVDQLRREKQVLQNKLKELERARAEIKEAPPPPRDQQAELEKLREDNKDLLRLRNEVRQLREQAGEAEVLRAANARLLQGMQETGSATSNEIASATAVRKQGAVLGVTVAPGTVPPGSAGAAAQRYKGVLVGGIVPDTAAARSDLKVGDIIVRLDGRPIENAFQLQVEMLTKKPGDTVVLDVMRNDAAVRVTVQTRSWPQ